MRLYDLHAHGSCSAGPDILEAEKRLIIEALDNINYYT
jgi:hypothetical protein